MALLSLGLVTRAHADDILVTGVAAGSAVVSSATADGSTTTTIQAADSTIIDYSRFDIAAGDHVQFIQPDAASRVLNRVTSSDPSQILGTLSANGNVYLVNPAGVFFGANAVVDVGGFFAAAGQMSNDDFLNHVDRFFDVDGTIENHGELIANELHLIAREIANHGEIYSPNGIVTLSSGREVIIGESGGHLRLVIDGHDITDPGAGTGEAATGVGIDNSGEVVADEVYFSAGDIYSLAIRQQGTVHVTSSVDAIATDVENTGTIEAPGGRVRLLGERVTVLDGRIDVRATGGGGEIQIGGDRHGAGPRTAQRTIVGDAELLADAIDCGDGGRVTVWSDGRTWFQGDIQSRGGSASGNGGDVEVSGRERLHFDGQVDASAANGERGTLLLDPLEIEVVSGGTLAPSDVDEFLDPGSDPAVSQIDPTVLDALGVDVFLEALSTITFSDAVTLTTPGVGLTARAGDDIVVDAPISTTGGDITLVASDTTSGVASGNGSIHIGAALDTSLGGSGGGAIALVVDGGAGGIEWGADLTSEGADITFAGEVALDHDVRASSGAGSGSIRFDDTVNGAHALSIEAGTGDMTLDAAVGGSTRIGVLDIESAQNVAANAVTAASIQQQSASGATSYGPLNTNDAAGIAITGNDVSLTGPIQTTGGGGLTVTNSGVLTMNGAAMLDGTFRQAGVGTTQLAASITTTGDAIQFDGAVTLTGDVSLDSTASGIAMSGADVSLLSPVDADSASSARDLTIRAGEGNIVAGDIGTTAAIGALEITSAGDVTIAGAHVSRLTQRDGTGVTTLGGPVSVTGDVDVTTTGLVIASTVSGDDITLTTDALSLNGGADSLAGTGVLSLSTLAASAIDIAMPGTVDPSALTLTASDIAAIASTFEKLTIGDASRPIAIRIGDATFGLATDVETGGMISAHGALVSEHDLQLMAASIALAGGTITPGGSTPVLTLVPLDPGTTIGLAGGIGDWQLTSSDLAAIAPGFGAVRIGRADGFGLLTTGAFASANPIVLRSPMAGGAIDVIGTLTGTGDASWTLLSGTGGIRLAGDITTAGHAITLGGAVTLAGDVRLSTAASGASGASIAISGPIDADDAASSRSLVFDAGSDGELSLASATGAAQMLEQFIIEAAALVGVADIHAQSIQQWAGGVAHYQGLAAGSGGIDIVSDSIELTADASATGGGISLNGSIDLGGTREFDAEGDVRLLGSVSGGGEDLTIVTSASASVMLGQVSDVGAIDVTSGSLQATELDAVSLVHHGLGGTTLLDGDVSVADSIEIDNAAVTITGSVAAGDTIAISADAVDLTGAPGSMMAERFALTTRTPTASIGIGDTVGDVQISAAELAVLAEGFASIEFGSASYSGTVGVSGITISDPLRITAGTIAVDSITGVDDASLTFDAGLIGIAGDVLTRDRAILFGGAVALQSDTLIDAGSASVAFDATIDSANAHDMNVHGDGGIMFSGAIGQNAAIGQLQVSSASGATVSGGISATSGITFASPVAISGDVAMDAGSAAIEFGATVDADGTDQGALTLTANDVHFAGPVGSVARLTMLSIDGSSTELEANADLSARDQIDISGALRLAGATRLTAADVRVDNVDAADGAEAALIADGDAVIGSIGTTHALASVTLNGAVELVGDAHARDDVTFSGALHLGDGSHTIASDQGNVRFAAIDAVGDGAVVLDVSAPDVELAGRIGGDHALAGLATHAETTRVTADIDVRGDITIDGPLRVAGDVTLRAIGGGIALEGTVDSDGTPRSLTLLTLDDSAMRIGGDGVILLGGDVGAESPLSWLALNVAPGIQARPVPSPVASIISLDGRVIRVADAFAMGQGEKFTVLGALSIDAGASATLGDLNSLGDLTVTAPFIRIVRRPGAAVLDAGGGLVLDEGVDFVSGGAIVFSVAPTLTGTGASPIFASTVASGSAQTTLAGYPLLLLEPGALPEFGALLLTGSLLDGVLFRPSLDGVRPGALEAIEATLRGDDALWAFAPNAAAIGPRLELRSDGYESWIEAVDDRRQSR